MTDLRPMTEAELERFAEAQADRPRTGMAAEVHTGGREAFDRLVPEGLKTPGHHFYVVVDDAGTAVGTLWFAIRAHGEAKVAFVFDVRIDEGARGRGHGRRAMERFEALARERGATRLALNVFVDNPVAVGLYESLGYETQSQMMRKNL